MATAEGANMNAADLAEQIARRCEKARPSGNGWQGCCPAHEDSSPSLTITPIDDKVLLHCFAGCEIDAILSALHMDKRDLFVSPIQRSNGHQRIATVYDYYDANGNLVHQTVRLDPKGFYQRRPDPAKPGEHIKNLQGIETVLYRLPELQDGIQSGHDVYICEGEKAVEAVCALGLTATCSPMGAGKWRDAYNPYLRGAHCIVLPDNDTPGQQHAQQVARSLYGLAASVRIVTLPGLPASGDAYDWKAAGGTREQLAALVQATAPWTPVQQGASVSSSTTQAERPCFKTVSAKALYAKTLPPQQFIIPKILPVGVTLFAGRGKDGKSLMVWNLCIAVATGGVALGQYPVEQGDVLYMALEDGERRAQQRLKDQMAYMGNASPPERLTLVLWDAPRIGEGFEERLTTWLDEHPQAQLVVIDILEKIRPKRTRNGSIYADDYNALASLQRLAQERNIAILVVHHSNKSKPEDFRDTASGSMGLIGACDTFWSLQRIAGAADAVLHIIGRDVEAQDLALRFADGFWTALGNAEEYQLTQASQDILNILRHADGPRTPKQLARLLSAPDATIRSRCVRMAAHGEILNVGEGRYIPRIPGSTTPPPPPPVEVDRSRGGESECTKCATPATPATVQLVQLMQLSPESRGRVAGTPEECNSDATLVTDGKDSALSDLSCRVAGVASSGQNGQGAQAMDVGQEDQGTQVLPVAQRVSQVNAGDTPDVSVPTPPFDAVLDDDADLPPEHRSDPLPTASHGTHATAPSCAHRWLQPGVYSRTCRDCGQREPLLAPPRRVSWAS